MNEMQSRRKWWREFAATHTVARTLSCACFFLCALAGCQQKMGVQPAYRPLEPSSLFDDGRSERPLVPGTVPRGFAGKNSLLNTGLVSGGTGQMANTASPMATSGEAGPGGKPLKNYSTEFPFEITSKELARGRERYTIYCSVCHGAAGEGNGPIVLRGFTRPPSYITDNSRGLDLVGIRMPLREAPVGYIFQVVTHGYGAMPDYASQVPVHDRWDIVAYVRVLQLSQRTPLDRLPEAERKMAETDLSKTDSTEGPIEKSSPSKATEAQP